MIKLVRCFARVLMPIIHFLEFMAPLGYLAARVWVSKVFLYAGIDKLNHWSLTLSQFQHQYSVPFIPSAVAAYVGTSAEIILPILLLFGLGGRISIFIFFLYNLAAMFSYTHLWTPEGAWLLDQHVCWGLLLALLMFNGSGKISFDYLIRRWYKRYVETVEISHLKKVDELSKNINRDH